METFERTSTVGFKWMANKDGAIYTSVHAVGCLCSKKDEVEVISLMILNLQ